MQLIMPECVYQLRNSGLAAGWPIAAGIIEGACRHLVKDRLDLTGARWGLQRAEVILKLRALRSNNDWDNYWKFHNNQERHRTHALRRPHSPNRSLTSLRGSRTRITSVAATPAQKARHCASRWGPCLPRS